MSEVKRLSDGDFRAFADIVANAYPSFKINSQEDKDKMAKRFEKLSKENGAVHSYGVFRADKLLGGMRLFDFDMNFNSSRIKAGGVGLVAVDLFHKKQGVCKELITYFLDHYKSQQVSLAVLYPFRPDFYKKMGFGFGAKMNQYKIKPENLPSTSGQSKVQPISVEESKQLLQCFNSYVDLNHGMIEKSEYDITAIFNNEANKIIGYKKDDKLRGYLIFEFKQDNQGRFLINDIIVKEFIYLDSQALAELMNFLYLQKDQINEVIFNTQDEDFHHLLKDPRNGSNNLIPSVYHESNTSGVGIMYRIIDIKMFFEELKNHNFNGQSLNVKITAADSFYRDSQHDVIVSFKDGYPTVGGEIFDVEISMDISDLSSLVMGAVSFKSLYNYGLVELSDPIYINIINKLFMTDQKPICMTAF